MAIPKRKWRIPEPHGEPRGHWVLAESGCAVHFGGIERGIEVPLDHVDTPHELWRTIIHFAVQKSCREQLGWHCSVFEDNADLGSLIMTIHDLRDLALVYRNGMSADAWNGSLNAITRWLGEELVRLPVQPSRRDYAILGSRVRDHAELLDLTDVFAD